MHDYNIFRGAGGYSAVKRGWSWPAWAFGWAWALSKHLWILAIGVALLYFTLLLWHSSADRVLAEQLFRVYVATAIVQPLVFGIRGNKWREKNLRSRGYKLRGTVCAQNAYFAIHHFRNASLEQQRARSKELLADYYPESIVVMTPSESPASILIH